MYTPNLINTCDVYKIFHITRYPKDIKKIYTYLEARGKGRGAEHINDIVFFGLQYYLKKYFKTINHNNVTDWKNISESILGISVNDSHMRALADLGYIPLRIKAVPEGTVIPYKQVLMSITNTHPDFAWLVNFIETLIMKIWSPITVASNSFAFKKMLSRFATETCDNNDLVPFQLHSFGARGCSSVETVDIAGSAHLTSFLGTDDFQCISWLQEYYKTEGPSGFSVRADEHSAVCTWTNEENDYEYIKDLILSNPTGMVSSISDTYNLWKVINWWGTDFKEAILARNGKMICRPDSGDPEKIICGDPKGKTEEEKLGVIRLLDKYFGHTLNSKGYKVLNPKVGCIYGDGIFYDRAVSILENLKTLGYASSNIVFGSGGLLLQQNSRDTLKMAIKATYCEVNNESRPIWKNPYTDSGKTSKKGLLQLNRINGEWFTKENCTPEEESNGMLETVFEDGIITKEYTLAEIRDRINKVL